MVDIGSNDLLDIGVDLGEQKSERSSKTADGAGSVRTDSPILGDSRNGREGSIKSRLREVVIGSRVRESLCTEGNQYLATLDETLNSFGLNLIELPPDGAYLATNGSSAIGLVFNEVQRAASTENEFIPACSHLDRISNDPMVTAIIDEHNLALNEMILIPESDYVADNTQGSYSNALNRSQTIAKLAANTIKNNLKLSTGAEISLEDLSRFPIRIVTNPSEVHRHLMKNYPGGVLPTYQTGFAVEICTDERILRDRYSQRNLDRDNNCQWDFLFMLGATTEFMDGSDFDEDRFIQPVVTITAEASTLRSIKMLPFMIACAEEIFINKGGWLSHFLNPSPDGANLGSLIIDPEDKLPMRLNSKDEILKLVHKCVNDPVLAVDVRYGAYNHPGFGVLMEENLTVLYHELQDMVTDDELRSVNMEPEDICRSPILESLSFYSGQVIDSGNLIDTRSIDYFRLVNNRQGGDRELCERFQTYFDNPEDRIRAISDAGWGNTKLASRDRKVLDSLYHTTKFIIDPDAIIDMLRMTSVLNIIRNVQRNNSSIVDFNKMREAGSKLRKRDSGLLRSSDRYNSRRNQSFGGFYRGRR